MTGDPAFRVVLLADARHVQWVFVDGKVRKRDGRLVDFDLNRLNRLAQASQQRLIEAAKLPAQS